MPSIRSTPAWSPLLRVLTGLMLLSAVHCRSSRPTASSLVGRSTFATPRRAVLLSNPSSTSILSTIRGGAMDESDDEYDESDDEDDELLGDFDLMDDADAEDDFDEDNSLDRFITAFQKTPPLTKAYLTASFTATLFGFLFNQKQFPQFLVLEWPRVLKRAQIWRPITTFLNFGPFGLGYALTMQFVWTYMSTLERLHHRKPYDFWIMICFGMLSMVIGYPILKVSPKFLGHNLSTFLVYVWSRYHEGLDVNMFDLFQTRAELLPWFFLLQTFLLEGEVPVMDFLGIAFGHVYHHCKTVGILRAPESLVNWYQESDGAEELRKKYKKIGSEFEFI